MFRGFLSGIIWGMIIVVVVVGLASLLAPLPATVTPQTSAAVATEGEVGSSPSDAPSGGSAADVQVDEPVQPDAPTQGQAGALPATDTASAPKPETATLDAAMSAPDAPSVDGAVAVEEEAPVLPNPQAMSPSAPAAEDEPSISNNPPQPQAPEVQGESVFPTPEGREEETAEAAPEPVEEEAADVSPSAEQNEESEAEATASVLKPAGDLKESFPQHKSERLPTVDGVQQPVEVVVTMAPKPVTDNAQPFENFDRKPVMSIVLLDLAEEDVNMDLLSGLPFPLTIAVSTLDPDVEAKAQDYRDRGYEVLAMIDLPAEASPSDVEVAMAAHLSVSENFVGVIEGVNEGLQGSRAVSDQVTAVLNEEGFGLLMFPKGLNTAQKLAAKEGVPSATVFRDFDSKGQTAVVIRRFLDQAAFKAGQEQGVVMVGRLREETISALLLWGLQDRANTVALAPVSAAFSTIQ